MSGTQHARNQGSHDAGPLNTLAIPFPRHWNAFTALAISVWQLIKAGLIEINDLFWVMFFNNLPELCLFYRVCFPVGERFFLRV